MTAIENIREVPFAKPTFLEEDKTEILQMIRTVLDSGMLTSARLVELLEARVRGIVGTKHAIALNSCTAALHSSLLALKIGEGDEVIVPSNTFVATPNAAVYVGAKPVFADSDPDTFNISPESVQENITPKTKAIIVVHLGGNPCDMDGLVDVAKAHKIPLVEDCAHALGSTYKSKPCGSFGITGNFSFYPSKVVTAAEGGMVTTDSDELAQRVKVIRNQGRNAFGPAEVTELGYNFRLSEIHAAIGLSQMGHLREFLSTRRRLAGMYDRLLAKNQSLKPQLIRQGNESTFYAYIVQLTRSQLSRDQLARMLAERGVHTSILYNPAHKQPFYVARGEAVSLPVAEHLGNNSIALPMYSGLTEEDVLYICNVLESITE